MLHGNTNRWRLLAALAVVVVLVALMAGLIGAQPAQAQGKTAARVLPPSSNPYGLSYGQWSVKWWQWAIGTKYSKSPLNTNLSTPAPCGTDQSGPVFFLGGALGGPGEGVHRDCAVPLGKALLIPIVNVEWDEEAMAPPASIVQLGQIAKSIADHTTDRSMSVDGVPIPDAQIYRTPSPVFFYTMWATDNLYNLRCIGSLSPKCTDSSGPVSFPGLVCLGGKCTAVSVADGYYVMLAPLTAGDHIIHFHGRFTTEFEMTMDIAYHLCVGATTCRPIPS
ncbi:MAG: hypothetical protein U0768_10975 [Anaerolineae bacterium]